jgi:hypothetical protein
MGIEEGEDIQTKGIDNLFNRVIAENSPNLEKEKVIQVQESYRTPNSQDQKRITPRHIKIKILSTQNKERILKTAKEKRQVNIKANQLE